MVQISKFIGFQRRHLKGFGSLPFLLFLLAMVVFTACHPPHFKKNQRGEIVTISAEDSLLGVQFPLLEHLIVQKDLLLQHSKPAKRVIVPDGKAMEGNFGSGVVELVFDEINGEPNNFFGHLEEGNSPEPIEFIIYGIPNKQLDRLVPGQKYRVHWIETVVNTEPFDDDRYRDHLTYRIEGI